jgi:hypothetical protein
MVLSIGSQSFKTFGRIYPFLSTRGSPGYKYGQVVENSWKSIKDATNLLQQIGSHITQ